MNVLWFGQTVAMIVTALAAGWLTLRGIRHYQRSNHDLATIHGVVVASTLTVIALGNVLTTYAIGIDNSDLRDVGGLGIRLALIVAVVYLIAAGPHDRWRD